MRQYFWGMEETGNRLELRGNIRYRFLPAKIFSPIFLQKCYPQWLLRVSQKMKRSSFRQIFIFVVNPSVD